MIANHVVLVRPSQTQPGLLDELLLRSGWTVYTAQTCREALQILSEKNISVVLCESSLPDGNWKDLLNGLAAFSCAPRLIVISRLADDALWAEVLNLGGYDVLAEPFDENEVARVVAGADRAFRSRAQSG